ncbi:MAG: transporter substrate-binding domain-containing protein [Oscillospiraceae bacterium]|nr:transporter substrate-binding domain-containing protein [Oscillospiraceae bacterium]
MKKILAILIIITMAALALAACGGNDDTGIRTLADLDTPGIRIGVQTATTGHIFADENFPDAYVDAFPLFADAVMALRAGSIDAVIIDAIPGAQFAYANYGYLVLLPETLTAEYYGIALQHGSRLTAMFDDAINQLRADGTFQAIYDYWILELEDATRYVSPPGTAHPNGTLLMATSAGFPPFELWEGDRIVGFDPCLAQAIGDILGYEIEILDMEFGAIIPAVQTGAVDFGMAGMTVRDDRREFVDFSQGYFYSGQHVLVRVP